MESKAEKVVDGVDREDIVNMIDARQAAAMRPVMEMLTELRIRIIGMDGNGTGSEGVLQRQDKKIADLDDGQKFIIQQLETINKHTSFWNKAKFYKGLPTWVTIIATVLALVVAYLAYKKSTGHEISKAPSVLSQNFDATLK